MSRKTLRVLSFSFLPSFFFLPPFTSLSPLSIIFAHTLPFREKCCTSFSKNGVLRRRQRGPRRKSKVDVWLLCPPQFCHSTLKSHPYPLRPTCSPHSLYIRDSQAHSPSSEHDLCNFFLLLIFKKCWEKYTGLVVRTHFMACQTRISCRISGGTP